MNTLYVYMYNIYLLAITVTASPRNLCFSKHLTGNVHAMAMIPNMARITLGHFITLFLWHATCTVKLYSLGRLYWGTLSLSNSGKRENRQFSKHAIKCCLIFLGSNLTLHGFKPLQISKAYAIARTPQSDLFDWLATSIILISSFNAVLQTKLAIKRTFSPVSRYTSYHTLRPPHYHSPLWTQHTSAYSRH